MAAWANSDGTRVQSHPGLPASSSSESSCSPSVISVLSFFGELMKRSDWMLSFILYVLLGKEPRVPFLQGRVLGAVFRMVTFRLAAFDRSSPLCRAFLLLYTLPAETLISKDLLIITANSQYSGFYFVCFFLFVFATLHGIWDPKFPDQGVNPCPLQWKRGVPTTGLPGKSLYSIFCKNLNEKRIWKIDTCACLTESLCYTPETNPTL